MERVRGEGRGAAGAKPVHDFSDVGFWQVFAAAARKHEVSVHLYLHDDFIVMDGSCLIIEQCIVPFEPGMRPEGTKPDTKSP